MPESKKRKPSDPRKARKARQQRRRAQPAVVTTFDEFAKREFIAGFDNRVDDVLIRLLQDTEGM